MQVPTSRKSLPTKAKRNRRKLITRFCRILPILKKKHKATLIRKSKKSLRKITMKQLPNRTSQNPFGKNRLKITSDRLKNPKRAIKNLFRITNRPLRNRRRNLSQSVSILRIQCRKEKSTRCFRFRQIFLKTRFRQRFLFTTNT